MVLNSHTRHNFPKIQIIILTLLELSCQAENSCHKLHVLGTLKIQFTDFYQQVPIWAPIYNIVNKITQQMGFHISEDIKKNSEAQQAGTPACRCTLRLLPWQQLLP